MTWPRPALTTRLLLAQGLVVLVSATTTGLVAALVGPPIFHNHLRSAGIEPGQLGGALGDTGRHVETAYTDASVISLAVALIAALAAATAISAYLARRVARPVAELADAAAEVADGRYSVRVSPPALGIEFDTLTRAFNRMAARLESIEATRRGMLADLAHEMRTPLATIEAYLDASEDGVAVPDEDGIRVLRTQATRLRRLADDIAAVSLAEEHHPDLSMRPVAPAALVRDAVAAARSGYLDKGVELTYRIEPGLPDVIADPDRMGQVLANLLENALRHTPLGGYVTVSAAAGVDGVALVVADSGDGIAEEHLPRIFERFYRADPARDREHGGSGIGLAIVRAAVAAQRGRVTADSPGPGHGATFTVSLPAGTAIRPGRRLPAPWGRDPS